MRMTQAAGVFVWSVFASAPAFAQTPKPLPVVVVDLRGFTMGISADATTATSLGLQTTDLSKRLNGFSAAASLFVKRGPGIGIGLGGELTMGRGRHTTPDTTGGGLDIKTATRITAMSGLLSLNFGQRNGFSYLVAGGGPMQLWSYRPGVATTSDPPRPMTLNVGAGARWFPGGHVAFTFDIRFYYTKGIAAVGDIPARETKRLLMLSAGISIR